MNAQGTANQVGPLWQVRQRGSIWQVFNIGTGQVMSTYQHREAAEAKAGHLNRYSAVRLGTIATDEKSPGSREIAPRGVDEGETAGGAPALLPSGSRCRR